MNKRLNRINLSESFDLGGSQNSSSVTKMFFKAGVETQSNKISNIVPVLSSFKDSTAKGS